MNELNEQFAAFGRILFRLITDEMADNGGDEWTEDAMAIAAATGLAERGPYNPAIHGECDAEPGATIWTWHHLPDGWRTKWEYINPVTRQPEPDFNKRGILIRR